MVINMLQKPYYGSVRPAAKLNNKQRGQDNEMSTIKLATFIEGNVRRITLDLIFVVQELGCPTTRHEGAWERGGIAPTHSRPLH
jgi:hypothetical protein